MSEYRIARPEEKDACIELANYVFSTAHCPNYVIDKNADIRHVTSLTGSPDAPGYIKRGDTI